jgi:hypothetical protein
MVVHTMSRLLFAPILITSLVVSAQERPPTGRVFTDSVRVDVVNVEVFVVDKKGRPVYGLEREDFELLVKGEKVEISNFYAPPAPEEKPTEPGPIALEAAEVPAPPRHIAVFVDHTNLAKARRPEVMASLRSLIEERLDAGDRIMIADYEAGLTIPRSTPRLWNRSTVPGRRHLRPNPISAESCAAWRSAATNPT